MRANALVVMAKAPFAGQVKTRLVPPLTPEGAAELDRALLLDLLQNLKSFKAADLFVAFTPVDASRWFENTLPTKFAFFPQRGENLGQRMHHVFEDLSAKGYVNIVVIGSDLPVMPHQFFEEAFSRLQESEKLVVLGPSRDGGYYLIGMNRPIPELFQDIPWSSNRVLSMTLRRFTHLGLTPYFLPSWFDIDTIEDLYLLYEQLERSPANSQQLTRKFLTELADQGKIVLPGPIQNVGMRRFK